MKTNQKYLLPILLSITALSTFAQKDSVKTKQLEEVNVLGSFQKTIQELPLNTTIAIILSSLNRTSEIMNLLKDKKLRFTPTRVASINYLFRQRFLC